MIIILLVWASLAHTKFNLTRTTARPAAPFIDQKRVGYNTQLFELKARDVRVRAIIEIMSILIFMAGTWEWYDNCWCLLFIISHALRVREFFVVGVEKFAFLIRILPSKLLLDSTRGNHWGDVSSLEEGRKVYKWERIFICYFFCPSSNNFVRDSIALLAVVAENTRKKLSARNRLPSRSWDFPWEIYLKIVWKP